MGCKLRYGLMGFVIIAWSMVVFGQLPAEIEQQSGFEGSGLVNQAWPLAGFHYSKLLLEGPSAEHYAELGRLFFEESYPKHARFYFELAAAIDPDNEDLKEDWKKAQDRISYLEDRFHTFSEKAAMENDPTYFGRLAAIRFHLGERREGIRILKNALQTTNRDPRLMPLVGTFQKQLQLEGQATQALYTEFKKAKEEKKLDRALNILGQINFVSLGHTQVVDVLNEAEEAFPGKINQESALLLMEFSRQFNQVDLPEEN